MPLCDAAVAERLGEAEVGEEGAVAFDQDVVRLDVAVDDAGGVGGVERFRHLAEQGDRAGRRQRPLAVDRPPQVAAVDQPHRHDQLAVDLARVEDRHHRRVVEAGGEAGLAQEALAEPLAVGQLAGDHLQRHRPFQAQVGGPVDHAHAAPRDQRVEAVARKSGADGEVCHRLLIRAGSDSGGLGLSPGIRRCLSERAARR